MKTIYLIGFFQAMFFIALLVAKKPFTKGDRLIVIWIAGLGVHLLSFYAVISEWFDRPYGVIMLLLPPLIYLYGPMLWIYTLWSIGKVKQFNWRHYLLFLPLFTSLIYYTYLFVFEAHYELDYFRERATLNAVIGMVFYMLNLFMTPVFVVIALIQIYKHQQNIKLTFSYTDKIDLQWLKLLAYGSAAISVVVWISHILVAFGILERDYALDRYIFLSAAVFVFVIGYNGFRQGIIYKFIPAPENDDLAAKYKKSALDEKSSQLLLDRLEQHIVQEKSYERNKLSLSDLSEALEVPSYQISQVLNTKLNKNFFDYINAFRVKEVQSKMFNPKFDHYSLLGIALSSGFNSKASFNRIFKDMTGDTPSAYKKKYSERVSA